MPTVYALDGHMQTHSHLLRGQPTPPEEDLLLLLGQQGKVVGGVTLGREVTKRISAHRITPLRQGAQLPA